MHTFAFLWLNLIKMKPEPSPEPSCILGHVSEKLKFTYIAEYLPHDSHFSHKNARLPTRQTGRLLFPREPNKQERPPYPHSRLSPHCHLTFFSLPKSPDRRKPDQQSEPGWVREGPGAPENVMGVNKANLTGGIWHCRKSDGSWARIM